VHTLLPSANDLTGSLQAGDTASKRLSSGGVLATAASSCSRRNRLGSLCFACLEAVDAHDAQRGQLLRSTDRVRLGLPPLHSHLVLNACDAAGTCRTSGRYPQHAQHVSSRAAHTPRPARLAAADTASRALQSAAAYPGARLPRTDEGLPVRPHPAALSITLPCPARMPPRHPRAAACSTCCPARMLNARAGARARLPVAHLAARVLPPALLEHGHLGVLELLLRGTSHPRASAGRPRQGAAPRETAQSLCARHDSPCARAKAVPALPFLWYT